MHTHTHKRKKKEKATVTSKESSFALIGWMEMCKGRTRGWRRWAKTTKSKEEE